MNFIGIIPARYASVRFPGKPLVLLSGKPVIQWVFERAASILENVYVATDDERIYNTVTGFGGKAVMTSSNHLSGTDRCAEAFTLISGLSDKNFTHIINIQGDEPFIRADQIEMLINSFKKRDTDIATLAKRITVNNEIFDPNKPKVVFCKKQFAMYFSRSPIPFVRNLEKSMWPGENIFYKHIGIYAYKSEILLSLSQLPQTTLEKAESLEQLRWLEHGYKIYVGETKFENIGIDTPEDLKKAEEMLSSFKINIQGKH